MYNSKAWLDGHKAGKDGAPEHNPYRAGPDMQSWFDGWQQGRIDAKVNRSYDGGS